MILLESREHRQWLSLISPCLRSLSFGSTLEKLKKLLKSLSQDAHQICNVFKELFRSITISFKRTTSFLMKLRKDDSRLLLKESIRIYGRDGKYIWKTKKIETIGWEIKKIRWLAKEERPRKSKGRNLSSFIMIRRLGWMPS